MFGGTVARAQRKEVVEDQGRLCLDVAAQSITVLTPTMKSRAIEDLTFPFEVLSDTAEAESWRKEVHRPIYHIHKWWARRLGTVFRATVLASLAPSGSDILSMFYKPVRFPGSVVMDPFMGSGTTLGEALKLGARAIGRDINPVAHFLVRNALQHHDRRKIHGAFERLEREIAPRIRSFYRAKMPDGRQVEALYYFWVKTLPCPGCLNEVDLFSSRVFAQHAYAKKFPRSQATCPHCGDVNEVMHGDRAATCHACNECFDPQHGPAEGHNAKCPKCARVFPIAKTARQFRHPPSHRLYAKLVLTPKGEKAYLAADDYDREVLAEATSVLERQVGAYPVVALEPGYNTDQAINYGYRFWHEFFNPRQLLCLSILADGIRAIEDRPTRELFVCLFSGTLEFNNMFASYKGEGTGAVRHMFAHHILKPERTPLEANLWGTPSSSGAFSTLYGSRILRALDYADAPTEIRVDEPGATARKISGLSERIGFEVADSFDTFERRSAQLYLSCGDSSSTDVSTGAVDAVVTDPPFYDNVHYSQLADFFHVWQRHIIGSNGTREAETTRAEGEVQDENAASFTSKLASVFQESHRVLKEDGLLVFTYHHSRQEGWSSVLNAVMRAGFRIVAAHPIKSEMSVAMPKTQTKEPIDLDIILVCRKKGEEQEREIGEEVAKASADQVERLSGRGRKLSRNDVRVIVMAQALRFLSTSLSVDNALTKLAAWEQHAQTLISRLHLNQHAPRGLVK
jgi:putative DNA methylase